MKKVILIILGLCCALSLASCGSTANSENSTGISESESNETLTGNITVYTRDSASGTREGFLNGISFGEGTLVSTVQTVTGNGDMFSKVAGDTNGIGYISLSTLEDSGCLGLAFNNVTPTEEHVIDGTYSLSRNFNYVKRVSYSDASKEEAVNAFLEYMESLDGAADIQTAGGIVDLTSKISFDKSSYTNPSSSITLKFGGSTSVEHAVKALTASFHAIYSNVNFELDQTGSSDGFKRTQGSEKDSADAKDLGFASREFKLTSSEACAAGTYGKLCIDAIVVIVNKDNKNVTNLTPEVVKSIYDGTISSWSDVK